MADEILTERFQFCLEKQVKGKYTSYKIVAEWSGLDTVIRISNYEGNMQLKLYEGEWQGVKEAVDDLIVRMQKLKELVKNQGKDTR